MPPLPLPLTVERWRQCYGCKVTDVQNTIDLATSWGAANVFTEGACDPTDPACTVSDHRGVGGGHLLDALPM